MMCIKCSFCGKEKTVKRLWHSDIAIIPEESSLSRKKLWISVCPDCRNKHTIQELYEKAVEERIAQIKKELLGSSTFGSEKYRSTEK